MTLISIVVPVYWNAGSLALLKQALEQVTQALTHYEFEFVFVDDGSGDSSFAVLSELAAADQRVRVLRLSRNFGSNPAILAGLSYAQGACAVVIAADLQDPPTLIPELVKQWEAGYQSVLAARRSRQDPLSTRFFATVFNYLFRRFVFPKFPPQGFDFMLIDRQVMDILVQLEEKNSYIFGQVMWAGFDQTVVYYDRQERQYGQSMWTFTKKLKYFIDAFSAFSYLPLRIATVMGFLMGGLGFLYAFLVILLRLLGETPITGWTSTIVVVLLASGTQLVLIGLLGEYLWRVLDETRRRPPFIIRTRINLEE